MNANKKTSFLLGLIVIVVGCLYIGNLFMNWGHETSGDIGMTYDQALNILQDADRIVVKGDLDKWVQKPSIWVGDQYLGNFEEKGFLDWKMICKIGKDDLFIVSHAGFDDSGPTLCKTGALTSTRYEYLYPDNSVAGYAEDTEAKLSDGSEKSVCFFYGSDLKQKPYYFSFNDGWGIYDLSGKLLVHAGYDFHPLTSTYTLAVTSYDGNVNLKDKMFLCAMVILSIESNNHQG